MPTPDDPHQTLEDWKRDVIAHRVAGPSDTVEFVVLGGPPAVGKTTALKLFKKDGILKADAVAITPDLVKSLYPELQHGIYGRHPEKSPDLVVQYIRHRDELVTFCIENKISVILDDHAEDIHAISNLVQKVRSLSPVVETALIGLVISKDSYHKRLTVNRIDAGDEYEFSMRMAQQFFSGLQEILPLFDVSVIIENDGPKPISPRIMLKGYSENGTFIPTETNKDVYDRCKTITCPTGIVEAASAEHENQCRGLAERGSNAMVDQPSRSSRYERYVIQEGHEYWSALKANPDGSVPFKK